MRFSGTLAFDLVRIWFVFYEASITGKIWPEFDLQILGQSICPHLNSYRPQSQGVSGLGWSCCHSLSGLLIRLLADREALRPVLWDRCTRTLENPSWPGTWQGLGYFPVHLILEALAVTNLWYPWVYLVQIIAQVLIISRDAFLAISRQKKKHSFRAGILSHCQSVFLCFPASEQETWIDWFLQNTAKISFIL